MNISKVLAKYLKGSVFDLDECCLRLSDVFYFSGIHIEGARAKLYCFFSCILGGKDGWEENKKRTKRSRRSLCMKHRDSLLKNKFATLNDSAEGQNLSGWF